MKILTTIKTAVMAAASLYYVRSTPLKQELLELLVKGRQAIDEMDSTDLTNMSVDELMGEIRYVVVIEGGYARLSAMFDIESEELAYLSGLERSAIHVAVLAQHSQIKDYAVALLEQLKTKFS